MPEVQDTEVTLGTGRLLALFFGLVFSLGRKSAPTANTVDAAPAVPAPVVTTATGPKPSGLKGETKPDCPTPDGCPQQPPAGSTSDELTFYKAVEQNDSNTQLQPAAKENPTVADTKPAPE